MNSNQPLVSIIVLCYNQAGFAVETLNSIEAQTYPNIQLIIIDDFSTDNSAAVIQHWIDENNVSCQFVRHVKNMGITRSCNEGLGLVKGTYYQVLACDDILMPGKFENQVRYLENHVTVTVIFGLAKLVDDNSNDLDKFFVDPVLYKDLITQQDFSSRVRSRNLICAPSVLVRTVNIVALGGYDENLSFEDWDLWLRVAEAGLGFKFVNEIVCKYRVSGSSITVKRNFEMLNAFYKLFQKHRIRDKETLFYFFSYYDKIGFTSNLIMFLKILGNSDLATMHVFLLAQWNFYKRAFARFLNYKGSLSQGN